MASRIELQKELEEILGSRNVYFQPPSSLKLKYPAIVYSYSKIANRHAGDHVYLRERSYDLTLVDSDPESRFLEQLLNLKYCCFDRHFVSDNLNHFVFTIYF